MKHPFVTFLVERHLLPPDIVRQLREGRDLPRDPIGSIAVSHALLTPAQIDSILDRQRVAPKRFGELATEMGFLRQEQMETLAGIQDLRIATHVCEALTLAGIIAWEEACQYLGSYLVHRDSEVMALMMDS